ncbi:MAG TPA: Hsp20 family protein [Acidimicrobiales bacterium]
MRLRHLRRSRHVAALPTRVALNRPAQGRPAHAAGHEKERCLMPMDAYVRDGTVVVHIDLLDADPATVAVDLDGDVLTVTAERPSGPAGGRERALWQRLSVGRPVDRAQARARLADGVLTVTLPLAAARPADALREVS